MAKNLADNYFLCVIVSFSASVYFQSVYCICVYTSTVYYFFSLTECVYVLVCVFVSLSVSVYFKFCLL